MGERFQLLFDSGAGQNRRMWKYLIAAFAVGLLVPASAAQTAEPASAPSDAAPNVIVQRNNAFYPAAAREQHVAGTAVLNCVAADTGLLSCSVGTETPAGFGFGAAALRVCRNFHVANRTSDHRSTAGGRVRLLVAFDWTGVQFSGAPTPSASPDTTRPLTGITILHRPGMLDVMHFYPAQARTQHVTGSVLLNCSVDSASNMTCVVAEEIPLGYGFGDAALAAMRLFRVAARLPDGRPTQGGRLQQRINFFDQGSAYGGTVAAQPVD
jgi:hypothetical protein